MRPVVEVTYEPFQGESLLIAAPEITVLLPAGCVRHIAALWPMLASGADVDQLLEWLIDEGFRSIPYLIAVEHRDQALRLLVRGPLAVTEVDDSGNQVRHSAQERRTWLDVTLPRARRLVIGTPLGAEALPLTGGVVAASGFVIARAEHDFVDAAGVDAAGEAGAGRLGEPAPISEAVEPAPGEAVPVPATVGAVASEVSDPFSSLTLAPIRDEPGGSAPTTNHDDDAAGGMQASAPGGEGPASWEGLGDHDGQTITVAELARIRDLATTANAPLRDLGDGLVRAVLCGQRHPNPPNEALCRVCGASLEHGEITTVPRPVLGSLVFDDGPAVALQGSIIVGRSPRASAGPQTSPPTLVSVQSPEHGVSRSHLEVRIEGWSVTVVDLGSTNGTEVALPGEAPRRLRRGEPCLVTPGAVLTLGDEVSARYQVAT